MDPFVRRLIERLHDPSSPLSRNRHFHTFDTPEGRKALRTSRRLKGLWKDILETLGEGRRAELLHHPADGGEPRVEVRLQRAHGRRVSLLSREEFELLKALPGMSEALGR